jgi:hypothetical protein
MNPPKLSKGGSFLSLPWVKQMYGMAFFARKKVMARLDEYRSRQSVVNLGPELPNWVGTPFISGKPDQRGRKHPGIRPSPGTDPAVFPTSQPGFGCSGIGQGLLQ